MELDYSDFLRFHRESAAELTQANHAQGALDLIAVDAKQSLDTKDSFRARLSAMIADRREYRFTGYVNALADPADFAVWCRMLCMANAGFGIATWVQCAACLYCPRWR